MKTIPVSELRANLMQVLKIIEQGSSLLITSRGKVVAQLVPPADVVKSSEEKLAQIRKTAKVNDVLSPISEKWEASS